MDIDQVVEIFRIMGIRYFNYLVHFDNLKTILMYDTIRSRNFLVSRDMYFHDISKDEYQLNRRTNFELFFPREDIHDYVPLYISSHTPLVKMLANPNYLYFAVLKIGIDVLENNKHDNKKVKFSNQNINQSSLNNLEIKELNDFESENDFKRFLRWDLFNQYFTNENDRLSKAAEILIPKLVHRKFIYKICLKNKQRGKIINALRSRLTDNFYDKIEDLIDFYSEEFDFSS